MSGPVIGSGSGSVRGPVGGPRTRRVYPGVDQVMLRAVVVLGAVVSLVAAQAAGAVPAQWQQATLVGLAVLTALRPDSLAGLGLLLWVAYVWASAEATYSPLTLVCLAGMVLAHVAALVAAQGPARLVVDRVQVRRWAGRGLVLWLAGLAVWGLTGLAADLPDRRLAYASGLVLLTAVAVLLASGLRPGRRESGLSTSCSTGSGPRPSRRSRSDP